MSHANLFKFLIIFLKKQAKNKIIQEKELKKHIIFNKKLFHFLYEKNLGQLPQAPHVPNCYVVTYCTQFTSKKDF